jgi:thiamine biosynthesis lipoprotein ApbE
MSWVQVNIGQNHMATTFDLKISCLETRARAAQSVLEQAHQEIGQLEDELSEFREASPVAQLNRAKAFEPVSITASVRELLAIGEALRVQTRGAFDPLWRSRAHGGAVLLDADGKHFFKTINTVSLGFGAIGKGYALDRVKLLLAREGFTDYLLSAGGSSIQISGFAGPGTPWRWAWSWKKGAGGDYLGRRFAHASGSPIALGVSGILEQGRHISTAVAECGSVSALVAHASAARADALSTALFARGWGDLETLGDPIHPTPIAWIDDQENLQWNGDFQQQWGSPC